MPIDSVVDGKRDELHALAVLVWANKTTFLCILISLEVECMSRPR